MLDNKKILLTVAVGGVGLCIVSNILSKYEDQKRLDDWSKSLYEDLTDLEKMAQNVLSGDLIYCVTNSNEMSNLLLDILKIKEEVSKAKSYEELDNLSSQVSSIINKFDELLSW